MFPRFRGLFYKKIIIYVFVIISFVIFLKVSISKLNQRIKKEKVENVINEFKFDYVVKPNKPEPIAKLRTSNLRNLVDYFNVHKLFMLRPINENIYIDKKKLINTNNIDIFYKNNNNIVSEDDKIVNEHNQSFTNMYEKSVRADLVKQISGLGDDGKGEVLIGTAEERGEMKLKEIALNEELSEQLRYDRTLHDVRNLLCKYQNFTDLPTTSVIIIYYNEPYSIILRTVHSVLKTTNDDIVKEIILVDDGSTNDALKGKLHYYVESRLPKYVKIITLPQRVGIVGARLAGARVASGDILMFMDAHCECNIEWLEPLATRLKTNKTAVLIPFIDSINARTLNYKKLGNVVYKTGGFNWNGHFNWIDIPITEVFRLNNECGDKYGICPIITPTMSGGLFAINREYFWEIGSYDDKMIGWGGENLEMSFRIWQCGGSIEIMPCSRIGHIFRDFQPYKMPDNKDTHGINTIRMAKVWMDEYINLFFMNRPDLKKYVNISDVTNRQMLREKLKCKDFNWYLNNIYPHKFIPTHNVQAYGHLRSKNLCLNDLQQTNNKPYFLGLNNCHNNLSTISQYFSLTNTGELRQENDCVISKNRFNTYYIEMNSCGRFDEEKIWLYKNNNLINNNTGLCADSEQLKYNDFVKLKPCNNESETQKWFFEH